MPTQHDPETNLLGTELLRVLRECLYGSEENGAFLDPRRQRPARAIAPALGQRSLAASSRSQRGHARAARLL